MNNINFIFLLVIYKESSFPNNIKKLNMDSDAIQQYLKKLTKLKF